MIKFFKVLRCLFGRHEPLRRAMQYEGHARTCPCRHCGAILEKRVDGTWGRKRSR